MGGCGTLAKVRHWARGIWRDRKTETHRWFHSYAAVWESQELVPCSLASVFLQSSGQQWEAMDRCGVRLTLNKQPFPLPLILLLMEHWALPREMEEGKVKGKKVKCRGSERKRGSEKNKELQTERKWWTLELFLATHAVVKKKTTQQVILLDTCTQRERGGAYTARTSKNIFS